MYTVAFGKGKYLLLVVKLLYNSKCTFVCLSLASFIKLTRSVGHVSKDIWFFIIIYSCTGWHPSTPLTGSQPLPWLALNHCTGWLSTTALTGSQPLHWLALNHYPGWLSTTAPTGTQPLHWPAPNHCTGWYQKLRGDDILWTKIYYKRINCIKRNTCGYFIFSSWSFV